MADNIEYLMLEQFRALRNQIEGMQTEMRHEFSDVKHRINRLESAAAGIRRDEAGIGEDIARQQSSIDRLKAPHYPHLFTACKSMACLPCQSSDSRR